SANSHEYFWSPSLAIARIGFTESHDAGNLGHGGAQFLRPIAHGGSAGPARTFDISQQLTVVGVREELDLLHSRRNFSRPPTLPQQSDAAVNQGRTDRALFHGQQFMRGELEISCRESWTDLDLQARAVAIVPRRGRVDLDVERQVELGRPT